MNQHRNLYNHTDRTIYRVDTKCQEMMIIARPQLDRHVGESFTVQDGNAIETISVLNI